MKRRDLIATLYNVDTALTELEANWQKGDLAAAVRECLAVQREVKTALEWWESDEG